MTKKKAPEDKKKVGRKTVMTQEVVTKLEEAFSRDCTDTEACLFAGISRMTLHRFQEDNPEFCDRKALLKDTLVLKARTNIAERIEKGDLETSKWYIERKKRGEFSTRQEVTGENGESLVPKIEILPVAVAHTEDETIN